MQTSNNKETTSGRVYQAPDSNTVIKRSPWYEKAGNITIIKPQSQQQQPYKPPTKEEETKISNFAKLPFANDIVKSFSALQTSFFVSIGGGVGASIYRFYKMKQQPVAVVGKGSGMIKYTGLLLSYIYGSSVLFLGSYLALRYREIKQEKQLKEMMGILNPDTTQRPKVKN